jgi:fatty acid desaturase
VPAPEPRHDDTPDPRERDLSRRSQTPAVGLWVIVLLILLAAALAYTLFAVL